MEPQLLMDKQDRISFEVLLELKAASNEPVNMGSVLEALDLTPYLLKTAISNVNSDIAETFDTHDVGILTIENTLLQGQNISNLVIQRLKLLYISRSSLLPAFEYHMFFDKLLTPGQYAGKTWVSRAAFYRNVKNVKSILKKEFKVSNKSLINNEFQCRLNLFQLYYDIYSGFNTPFSNLDDLVQDIINVCKPYFDRPLRLSEQFKFSIFLRIWILRHRNQGFNTDLTVRIETENKCYNELFHDLKKVMGTKFNLDQYEMSYLYGFLLAKQFITRDDAYEISENFPLASSLTTNFLKYFKASSVTDEPIDETTESALEKDLLNVNLQLTSFYIEPMTFIRKNSMKFFKKSYPSFDIVVNRFFNELKKQDNMQNLDEKNWTNLYYGYIFALINNIPAEVLSERVYVAVDFSQGDLYTNYVINSLQAFHHANIVIEDEVSRSTDIFISDIYSPQVSQPQLTWEDPPTPLDWEDLGSLIEELRAKKAFELFRA